MVQPSRYCFTLRSPLSYSSICLSRLSHANYINGALVPLNIKAIKADSFPFRKSSSLGSNSVASYWLCATCASLHLSPASCTLSHPIRSGTSMAFLLLMCRLMHLMPQCFPLLLWMSAQAAIERLPYGGSVFVTRFSAAFSMQVAVSMTRVVSLAVSATSHQA